MRAILLCAGVGRRMAPLTDSLPKCLIPFAGKTLLCRHLEYLVSLGIEETILVVGHLDKLVLEEADRVKGSLRLRCIFNPRYTEGSILSLWAAREELEGDILIMDADVLYPRRLLEKLVQSRHPSCVLLDEAFVDTGEEMKLLARGEQVVALARRLPDQKGVVGEGVGFLKLKAADVERLRAVLDHFVAEERVSADYEEAIDDLMRLTTIRYEPVDGLPWIELDFPEDVVRAEREVLPRVEALDRASTRPQCFHKVSSPPKRIAGGGESCPDRRNTW